MEQSNEQANKTKKNKYTNRIFNILSSVFLASVFKFSVIFISRNHWCRSSPKKRIKNSFNFEQLVAVVDIFVRGGTRRGKANWKRGLFCLLCLPYVVTFGRSDSCYFSCHLFDVQTRMVIPTSFRSFRLVSLPLKPRNIELQAQLKFYLLCSFAC